LGDRFHTAGREDKGWAYLVVLVAGKGAENHLGTWRRAAATAAQLPPRGAVGGEGVLARSSLGVNGGKKTQGCSRTGSVTPCDRVGPFGGQAI
jgi:hypothetical protein